MPADRRHIRDLQRALHSGIGDTPVLLDGADVAQVLGINAAALKRRVALGQLEDHVMVGNRTLIRAAEVRSHLPRKTPKIPLKSLTNLDGGSPDLARGSKKGPPATRSSTPTPHPFSRGINPDGI